MVATKNKQKPTEKKPVEKASAVKQKEISSEKAPKKYQVRGRIFVAKVISAKMRRTVVCMLERLHFDKKYRRHEKRRKHLKAHNPDNIGAKEGDIVKIGETRPISKTKSFVVIEKVMKK